MSAVLHRPRWTDTAAASPALLSPSRVAGVGIHWLGPAAPRNVFAGDEKAVAQYLRGIRRFHMAKGWSDIAYQFAVDNAGRRWELRGWRRQSAANGDQHVNQTHGAIVALLGLGQTASPAMLDGLRDAVADFRRQYPGARGIKTHNQLRPDPTSCPGPQLTRLVKAGSLDPSRRQPARPKEEDDMTLDELVKALRDKESPLSVQLRDNVRRAVQAELADQAAGRNG